MPLTNFSNPLQLVINFSLVLAFVWLFVTLVVFLVNRLLFQCPFGTLTTSCPSNVQLSVSCRPGFSNHRLRYNPTQGKCCCTRCCRCTGPIQLPT